MSRAMVKHRCLAAAVVASCYAATPVTGFVVGVPGGKTVINRLSARHIKPAQSVSLSDVTRGAELVGRAVTPLNNPRGRLPLVLLQRPASGRAAAGETAHRRTPRSWWGAGGSGPWRGRGSRGKAGVEGVGAQAEARASDRSLAAVRPGTERRRCRFRPVEAVGVLRKVLERSASGARRGITGRVASWLRAASVALVGLAAAAVVMGVSAGPAGAASGTKQRMSNMPESQYVIREELQELMQSAPHERAIDLNDLTVWEEELNKLDMFSDKVKPPYATKEALRLKYTRYLEDQATGGKQRGVFSLGNIATQSGIAFAGILAVVTVVGTLFKAFMNMAKQEEVDLYGEEVSVDATEKDPAELEALLSEDDEDPDVEQELAGDGGYASDDEPATAVDPPYEAGAGIRDPVEEAEEEGGSGGSGDDGDDLLGI